MKRVRVVPDESTRFWREKRAKKVAQQVAKTIPQIINAARFYASRTEKGSQP